MIQQNLTTTIGIKRIIEAIVGTKSIDNPWILMITKFLKNDRVY